MDSETPLYPADAYILRMVARAERGEPMTDEEIASALAGFEDALAATPPHDSEESVREQFASWMKAHRAVIDLLHRHHPREVNPDLLGRSAVERRT